MYGVPLWTPVAFSYDATASVRVIKIILCLLPRAQSASVNATEIGMAAPSWPKGVLYHTTVAKIVHQLRAGRGLASVLGNYGTVEKDESNSEL